MPVTCLARLLASIAAKSATRKRRSFYSYRNNERLISGSDRSTGSKAMVLSVKNYAWALRKMYSLITCATIPPKCSRQPHAFAAVAEKTFGSDTCAYR